MGTGRTCLYQSLLENACSNSWWRFRKRHHFQCLVRYWEDDLRNYPERHINQHFVDDSPNGVIRVWSILINTLMLPLCSWHVPFMMRWISSKINEIHTTSFPRLQSAIRDVYHERNVWSVVYLSTYCIICTILCVHMCSQFDSCFAFVVIMLLSFGYHVTYAEYTPHILLNLILFIRT